MSNPSLERQGNDRSDEVSSTPPPNVTESSPTEATEGVANPPSVSGPDTAEEVQAPQRP
ncbi:MAG: hypothetical protein M3P95_07015 [Actinomycetota bacterium]|jgi:hypothetical protein|nr:hypothetical protein [Actinomycetota bacterium]